MAGETFYHEGQEVWIQGNVFRVYNPRIVLNHYGKPVVRFQGFIVMEDNPLKNTTYDGACYGHALDTRPYVTA